jgi:2-amino-4-hydroxy-6-hydroxymethyldihydropteridine diphosphokinase
MITLEIEMINGGITGDKAARRVRVFLGLGSNLGDRRARLVEAVRRIEAMGIGVAQESSIYETEPVGYLDQPYFLNQVIEVYTEEDPDSSPPLQARSLLDALQGVERDMGRERILRDGPRVIDIDLLLYGSLVLARADIAVPHPRMHLRRFVLEPICEIAPRAVHPSLGKTFRDLLDELEDRSVVRLYEKRDG